MTEDKTILAELIERRDEVLEKLRDREPMLVAKLTQLNLAIAGIEGSGRPVQQDEYSGFRKPSDAIFGYLDIVQKPQVREEMCQALVDGGYGRGTKTPYWILVRMVNYQIERKRLKEINGLVGKAEWPKALFEAQKEAAHPKA